MKEGPDIASLGALIGDPARANMLTALLSGKALTASELATEAGITAQTASSHLARLVEADLVRVNKQGRHRYFALTDSDVADLLENLTGLAASRGLLRTRTGPKDPALREARVCYDHLAGEIGVRIYDSLLARDFIRLECNDDLCLTADGSAFLQQIGISLDRPGSSRRPMCKPCLDWSARRHHLAGHAGAAVLQHFIKQDWVKRSETSRLVTITPKGTREINRFFPVQA